MKKVVSNISKILTFFPLLISKNINLEQKYIKNQQIQTSLQRIYLVALDSSLSQFKLFSLGNNSLGNQIAAHLDIDLSQLIHDQYIDGQFKLQILDSIRGHNVYLLKVFDKNKINDGLIQLFITVNTLKKQGAQKVICILPFFPYSEGVKHQLQDDKVFFTSFAADILKLLQQSGCDCVVTFNSLMSYPKGYVNQCKFININAPDLFIGHITTKKLYNPILVSLQMNKPNINSVSIIKQTLQYLNFDCSISTFNSDQYIGDNIQGNDVILYSNIIRNVNQITKKSKQLKNKGARDIYGCNFHNLISNSQVNYLKQNSYLKQFITTNSFCHQSKQENVKSISLARIIAQMIASLQQNKNLTHYRSQRQKQKINFVNSLKNTNHVQSDQNHNSNKNQNNQLSGDIFI